MNQNTRASKRFSMKMLVPQGIGSDPYTDWPVMVGAALAFAVTLIYFGYAAYASVVDRLAVGESTTSERTRPSFDATALSKAAARRAQIDAARGAALKGYVGPADPSI